MLGRVSPRLQPYLVTNQVDRCARRLDQTLRRGAAALSHIAGQRRSRFERVAGRLRPETLLARIEARRRALDGAANLLSALSYTSVLRRGFGPSARSPRGRS